MSGISSAQINSLPLTDPSQRLSIDRSDKIDATLQKTKMVVEKGAFIQTSLAIAIPVTILALIGLSVAGMAFLTTVASPLLLALFIYLVLPLLILVITFFFLWLDPTEKLENDRHQLQALNSLKTPAFRNYLQTTFKRRSFTLSDLSEAHQFFEQRRALAQDPFEPIRYQEHVLQARLRNS